MNKAPFKNSNYTQFDYHQLISFKKTDVEIVSITHQNSWHKEFRHQNKFAKLFFFLFREGLSALVEKVTAIRFYEEIGKKAAFIIVKVKNTNEYCGGFQFSLDQPVYYFLKNSIKKTLPVVKDYDLILDFNPFLGYIPLKVKGISKERNKTFMPIFLTRKKSNKFNRDLYIIGSGFYIKSFVLPFFKKFNPKVAVDFNHNILTANYLKNFEIRTNDFSKILEYSEDEKLKCGIIASYHSYHTQQAIDFLKMPNSVVVIEKPPCVTFDDLRMLLQNYDPKKIYIGYNRRFIKWNAIVRDLIAKHPSPCIINISITEAQISKSHWYYAPNQGTRIAGNLCHWVDLVIYLLQKKPIKVMISRNDKLGIEYSSYSILFEDGSIANLTPTDLGDGTHGVQEFLHIRNEELDIKIDDYLRMRIWEKGRTRNYYKIRRDKGHAKMYRFFNKAITNKIPSNYSKTDLIYSTLTYISLIHLSKSDFDSLSLNFDDFENAIPQICITPNSFGKKSGKTAPE